MSDLDKKIYSANQVIHIEENAYNVAINECIDTLKGSVPLVDNMSIIYGFRCAIERLEQLKESKKRQT